MVVRFEESMDEKVSLELDIPKETETVHLRKTDRVRANGY